MGDRLTVNGQHFDNARPGSKPWSPPAEFAHGIVGIFGDAGAAWLAHLPELLARYAEAWRLRLGPPFDPLSINYVAPAIRADGTPAVLKLGVPNPELITEIEALRLYDGRGAARLLEADPPRGALLLERLQPGTMLSELGDDEEATRIAAGMMHRLWRPLPAAHPFPTLARWTAGLGRMRQRFEGGSGPFPASMFQAAESLLAELSASAAEPVLLHADLHHFNILAAEREPWLAIDPKGVAGEPAYEAAVLLANPFPQFLAWPHLEQVTARRIAQLAAELGFDRRRIARWALVQAVLSGCWAFEDHVDDWGRWLAVARLFLPLVE
jgi:streptomycin 6-kinase